MKFLLLKKRGVFAALAAVLVIVVSSLALGASGGYAVFYNGTVRKLPIYSVGREDKTVSISFDAAWGTEHTDKILENLEHFGVKATFFLVEFWTTKYPDYVRKISEAGHEIGTHSSTHSYMSKLDKDKITQELSVSAKAISDITGKKVDLFRPPYGDYNDRLIQTAEELGFYTIQWDVDSLDWKDLSARQIADRVISRAKNGSIILCHNNGKYTAEALPIIFADLQNKGYKFVPIGELIYRESYEMDVNGVQHQLSPN